MRHVRLSFGKPSISAGLRDRYLGRQCSLELLLLNQIYPAITSRTPSASNAAESYLRKTGRNKILEWFPLTVGFEQESSKRRH